MDLTEPNLSQDNNQNNQQGKKHEPLITFGSQKPKGPPQEIINLTSQLGELGRKIRILEDRYSNVRRKTQVTDQNMLQIQKNLNHEIKVIDDQILELQKLINKLDEKLKQILRELKNFADLDELKVLRRYVDFWKPVGFVTKSEAERLVRDIIEENRKI